MLDMKSITVQTQMDNITRNKKDF